MRNRHVASVAHATDPIGGALRDLRPLRVSVVGAGSHELGLFNCLLDRYHYLGHRNTVGENLRYLARDRRGRPLGCVLFGSAAWTCAARDLWIGWERSARQRNLGLLTNNTRFLVLPWVTVPHLASHLLGLIARRIGADWQAKYGHPVHALETFVERRFRGTCYRCQLGAARRNPGTHPQRPRESYPGCGQGGLPVSPDRAGSCAHAREAVAMFRRAGYRGACGAGAERPQPRSQQVKELVQQVQQLSGRLEVSEQRVKELEDQLADSRNSSRPPSSDGLKKPKQKPA